MMRRAIFAVMFALVLVCGLPARAGETARESLAKRVPAAKLSDTSLSDALDFVRDVSGVNINVDWKTLEAAGITRDTPIALDVHDVSAGRLLKMVLSIAGQKEPLTAYIEDGVVEITTRAADDAKMITVVYDVTDLISIDDHFNPIANLSNMTTGGTNGVSGFSGTNNSSNNTGQGGSSTSNFGSFGGGNNSGNNNTTNNGASNKETKANHLIQVIQASVRPDIWQVNGGKATIVYFNNKLIVSAPRSVQRLIGG